MFRMATGSTINEEKTEGLRLNSPKWGQPELEQIIWKNKEGMRVLGIFFFPDFIHTQQHNWTAINNDIKLDLQRSKARELSLKGRTLVLNTLVLSKVWYLATVIAPPPNESKVLIRAVVDFFWQLSTRENQCIDPIQRKILYQPLNKGGMNLKDVDLQVKALQLKFIKNIVDPECTHPWVHLARYYIGFRLSKLHPDWTFLAHNTQRRDETRNITSKFYKDLIQDTETLDLSKTSWVTPHIYLSLREKDKEVPLVPHCWGSWYGHGANLNRLFTHVHWTDARGAHQDVMWKFIHRIVPTN